MGFEIYLIKCDTFWGVLRKVVLWHEINIVWSWVGISSKVHIGCTLFLYRSPHLSLHMSMHKMLEPDEQISWSFIQQIFASLCRIISVWIKCGHSNTVHIVVLCVITLCHIPLCSSYQAARCLYQQGSKMKIHISRNLKDCITWKENI
jgi:hypothetical protein